METKGNGKKGTGSVTGLRIEQVSSMESPKDGIHVEITTEESSQPIAGGKSSTSSTGEIEDDDDNTPSLSSEQLARRPSFKRILDDLSSADATLKAAGTDPLALATLQAQQAALQQAAASSLVNPALIPGLLQGMQSLAAGVTNSSSPSSSASDMPAPPPIMMQPLQQSLQLQSALLSAASNSPAPLIAGAATVQSLAGQSNIPASLLSNAINMAASLSNSSASISSLTNPGHPSMLSVNTSSLGNSSQASLGTQVVADDQGKKREIRLMKNREAARECRRKKKEYVRCLENRVAVLESQNQALIGELRALKELYLPKNSNQE